MRLKQVKLVGFKSFVDHTKLGFKENLTAIVGPNGCGKSNIIDAIRWVMGESAAKHLRGQSMTDVIFNGSENRKPVNKAAVELVFDNSEGKARGSAAGFNEIVVRRELDRDAKSTYLINGTACRKRDITDIFLGTGISPRSYAIIEQGMISRLIESKPEDLRVFIEEAAGISRYKERRRETENRIRRTRENLERVSDLKDELTRQVAKLERQAESAKKYKVLKSDERKLKATVLGFQYQALTKQLDESQSIITGFEQELTKQSTELLTLRSSTDVIAEYYQAQQEQLEQAQAKYFEQGAEVSKLQEKIRYENERRETVREELVQLKENQAESAERLKQDQEKQALLLEQKQQIEPETELLSEQLEQVQENVNQQKQLLDEINAQYQDAKSELEEQKRKINQQETEKQYLQRTIDADRARIEKLLLSEQDMPVQHNNADDALSAQQLSDSEAALVELQDKLTAFEQETDVINAVIEQSQQNINQTKHQQRQKSGQLSSLKALQQAATKQQKGLAKWLESQNLSTAQPLIETLKIESRWAFALESVLANFLQAKQVERLDDYLSALPKSEYLSLVESVDISTETKKELPSLASQLKADSPLAAQLAFVYCADSIEQASQLRSTLASHESVITDEGLWLGVDWMIKFNPEDPKLGSIQRQQDIQVIEQELADFEHQLNQLDAQYQQKKDQQEQQRGQKQALVFQIKEAEKALNQLKQDFAVQQAKIEQIKQQQKRMADDKLELEQQIEQNTAKQQTLSEQQNALSTQVEMLSEKVEELAESKESTQLQYESYNEAAQEKKEVFSAIKLQVQGLELQYKALEEAIERSISLDENAQNKLIQLERELENLADASESQSNLEMALAAHEQAKLALAEQRELLQSKENEKRDADKTMQTLQQTLDVTKEKAAKQRVEHERYNSAIQANIEKLDELNSNIKQVSQWVDEAVSEQLQLSDIEQQLATTQHQVSKIGAVNLAAIDELDEQRERLEFINQQYDDLIRASEILESAINKIDKETKARFRETFEFVNEGFKSLFPKIFGGGSAYLELLDQDLLSTGITIMARPPGKQNSTIHLLSGGEKALTALALVFSIFELNPAPFCLLDEVDAPLDDVNVGRYNKLVQEMSKKVQFIFITHNKITMQMADALMGVTMREPGVSGVVSVDIEQAIEYAQ